jgi:hypothetical protein
MRVQVWDCCTQQHLFSLARHPGSIMDVAADADLVASTCGKELRLWDLATRSCISTRAHNSPIDLAGKCACVCAACLLLLAADCINCGMHQSYAPVARLCTWLAEKAPDRHSSAAGMQSRLRGQSGSITPSAHLS